MTQKGHQHGRKHFSIRNLISALLLIFAVAVLFYPIVANYLAGQRQTVSIETYKKTTDKLDKDKLKQLLGDAQTYNNYIYAMNVHQNWTQAVPDYKKQLIYDYSGMFGYLAIPQIKLKNVPIYQGDSQKTMEAGVGHVPQTSLPVGGVNTHAVLSTHSGRVNNTLFTDLEDLKLGDTFYIHVLNLELKYRIDGRKIVEPDEVSSLGIVAGKDLVTLATCWPTGVNSKRLLVTGHRVPNNVKLPQEKIQRNKYGYNFWVMLGSIILALLGALLGLFTLLWHKRHIIRVDRAQFTAIQQGRQRLLIVPKKILDADSHTKSSKTHKAGNRILFKAWEEDQLPDGEREQHYFRQDKDSTWQEAERRKAERQKAKLTWIADSSSFNQVINQAELDLGEKYSSKHLPDGTSLEQALQLIRERLGTDDLPDDCLLLGIKLR
ncbi:hypothetical protein OfM1_19620 [Lactovum odontotermitis]